ncbi:hypothetical protein ABES21_21345 [Peribacillus frigoritolerans]|uniref:hypothetical protein n=1 Tax=Peribacillus frigoritolerans TaxID=450367 RepID=UPI003D2AB1B3
MPERTEGDWESVTQKVGLDKDNNLGRVHPMQKHPRNDKKGKVKYKVMKRSETFMDDT